MATLAETRPDEVRFRTRLLGRAAALLALGSALVHLLLVDATMLTLHAQMLGAAHGPMAHGTAPAAGLLGLALVVGQLALAGVAALRR